MHSWGIEWVGGPDASRGRMVWKGIIGSFIWGTPGPVTLLCSQPSQPNCLTRETWVQVNSHFSKANARLEHFSFYRTKNTVAATRPFMKMI